MKPLHVALKRSPSLDRVIIALHVLAVLCAALAGIAWIWKLALTAAIAVDYWFYRNRGSGRVPAEWLAYSHPRGWNLEQPERAPQAIAILPGSLVTPWLVILHGKIGNQTREWIIARDSADEETFRCLRVYLKVLPLTGRQTSDSPSRGI